MDRKKNVLAAVVMMATLLLSLTACGGDDDDTIDANLQVGTSQRPVWEVPSGLYQQYEQTMAVQAVLQEELQPYVSENDLMCVMEGNEIRCVCAPQFSSNAWLFSLVIAGSTNDAELSVAYYCDRLKRVYKKDKWLFFRQVTPPTLSNGQPYVIQFFQTVNKETKE